MIFREMSEGQVTVFQTEHDMSTVPSGQPFMQKFEPENECSVGDIMTRSNRMLSPVHDVKCAKGLPPRTLYSVI